MPTGINSTGTIDNHLALLHNIERQDKMIEAQAAETQRRLVWSIIGIIAAVGLLILIGNVSPNLLPIGFIVLVMSVAIAFGVWAKLGDQKKQDIEDRRIQLPLKFLGVIGRDISPAVPVALNVDFQGYKVHGKLLEQNRGNMLNPVSTFKYADNWFGARGKLADGNRFNVSIKQNIKRKEKRKRKYTKVNERIDEDITLVLRISPTRYPNWQLLNQYLSPGVHDNLQITRLHVAPDGLRLVCTTPEVNNVYVLNSATSPSTTGATLADGDTLLRLFLYVYNQLEKCRGTEQK
ncbi:MAG: hypothetical protein WCJ56_01660 [bacterium]